MSDNSLAGSAEQETVQTGKEAVTETTEKTTETEAKVETVTTADAEKPDKASADQPSDDQKPKRKNTPVDERIAHYTRVARSAERAAESAIKRAEAAEGKLKQYETPAPRETDFQSFDQYQAALTAHHVKQAIKPEREAEIQSAKDEAKQAETEARDATLEAFKERENEFADRIPDYHEKVSDSSLPISSAMANEIQVSEKGPEIAYFLATNRAEAARIARLTDPRDVLRAIAKIEGRIGTPPPKKITTAPAPVKAVATGSGSKAGFDPHTAGLADYTAKLKRDGVLT